MSLEVDDVQHWHLLLCTMPSCTATDSALTVKGDKVDRGDLPPIPQIWLPARLAAQGAWRGTHLGHGAIRAYLVSGIPRGGEITPFPAWKWSRLAQDNGGRYGSVSGPDLGSAAIVDAHPGAWVLIRSKMNPRHQPFP